MCVCVCVCVCVCIGKYCKMDIMIYQLVTIVVLCLTSYLIDYHMRFRVVGLSISSVPTLCLKGPQMGMTHCVRNF